MVDTISDDLSLILQRQKASRDWWNDNYWGEFIEVYRSSKCRTKPIMVKDPKTGKTKEDKTRTNVAMPDMSRVIRQNTARLTANPPLLNYLCDDEATAMKLTTWRYQQYDRSGEAMVRRLHIQQEETFGLSITKSFWDRATVTGTYRFPSDRWDRRMLMEAQGYAPDEVQNALKQLGPTLHPYEVSMGMAQFGDELTVSDDVVKYEGPRSKFVFMGDIFPEPGFRSIHDGWIVEMYYENEAWLKRMLDLTYEDEDGNEVPVFDIKAAGQLESDGSFPEEAFDRGNLTLRQQLRSVIGQSDLTKYASRGSLVRGKRFKVLECHEEVDGKWWITWIGNDKIKLGKMPYQHDLRGRNYYTPFVGLPDLVSGVGDSTPRLMRFLYNMRNAVSGMTVDLLNQILRRTVFRQKNSDIPDEAIERAFYRIIDVKKISDIQVQQDPDIPAGAFAVGSDIKSEIQTLEPSIYSIAAGIGSNPMPGQTATTAALAQKSNDALLDHKVMGLMLYDKEVGEKYLLMLQQSHPLDKPIQLDRRYAKREALASLLGDKTSVIELNVSDIQYDIGVEPEAGSTLAQDDEWHRMAAERFFQLAAQFPHLFDANYAAKVYAKTLKGVDANQAVLPPAPPPPMPPKTSISVTFKGELLPAGVVKQLLVSQGIQLTPEDEAELDSQDQLKAVKEVGEAAEAAGKLAEPAFDPKLAETTDDVERAKAKHAPKGNTKKSSK